MAKGKKKKDLHPIVIEGRTIAKSWWGKAWNQHLEVFSDFSNRLPRARTYLRQGHVIDLRISAGRVDALVSGSRKKPYQVIVAIRPIEKERVVAIKKEVGQEIGTLETLITGKFPKAYAPLFTDPEKGLFPAEDDIELACSCPDWAYLCKHVGAVLYGIGAKFDEDPLLFFELRGIDVQELIQKTIDDSLDDLLVNAKEPSDRVISQEDMAKLFGL